MSAVRLCDHNGCLVLLSVSFDDLLAQHNEFVHCDLVVLVQVRRAANIVELFVCGERG